MKMMGTELMLAIRIDTIDSRIPLEHVQGRPDALWLPELQHTNVTKDVFKKPLVKNSLPMVLWTKKKRTTKNSLKASVLSKEERGLRAPVQATAAVEAQEEPGKLYNREFSNAISSPVERFSKIEPVSRNTWLYMETNCFNAHFLGVTNDFWIMPSLRDTCWCIQERSRINAIFVVRSLAWISI